MLWEASAIYHLTKKEKKKLGDTFFIELGEASQLLTLCSYVYGVNPSKSHFQAHEVLGDWEQQA